MKNKSAFKLKSGNKPNISELSGASPAKVTSGQLKLAEKIKGIRKKGYEINKATGHDMPTVGPEEAAMYEREAEKE